MSRRFQVALTYCRSRKPYVAEVARLLAAKLGKSRVLFDDFHTTEFARDDLPIYLPALYHNDSDLVVAVLDEAYFKSKWCGLEWKAVFSMLMMKRSSELMLTRFDHVIADGFFGHEGYVELDDVPASVFANRILERLRQGNPETANLVWPEVDVRSNWCVANHQAVLESFEELLRPTPKFRAIRITGDAGTGKSTLTKMLANATAPLETISSGRLDFKGTTLIDVEICGLAANLAFPAPDSKDGVPGKLSQLMYEIKNRKMPTVIIFDTFEVAGSAGQWLCGHLVPLMVRAPWLRVVIAGQQIPKFDDQGSKGIFGPLHRLVPPRPEDWFEYLEANNLNSDETDLAKIIWAHKQVNGSPALLAQFLVPAR